MSRTIKILVGIVISVFLFYLFIKDVNKIRISDDSGAGHGSGTARDRVLYVSDGCGLQPGDSIVVTEDSLPEGIPRVIVDVLPLDRDAGKRMLVTDRPFEMEFKVAEHAAIKFPRLQRALTTANYWWLLPALILTLVALWIRAYRWKIFFPEHRGMRLNSLWIAVNIGYMANNVLPFRMGEIIRAWILGRKENRKISESFATIVMERVFDILSILILFVGFTFYFAAGDKVTFPIWLIQGAWILTAISLLALLFLLALRFKTDPALRLVAFFLKPVPAKFSLRIMKLFGSFIQGLNILSSIPATLGAFTLSMVIWLDLAGAYYFMFRAVGIDATLLVAMFLIVGLAFAVSIPSAPGFIGTFHYVGREILIMTGIKGNLEAYVLLAHAMAFIPVVVLGLIYLSMENLTFKDLRKSMGSYARDEGYGIEPR
ncbi:flippase-like domain-containing protein [bacterium]|nr:flippase-like domain-containing protein [candidate division CSSED10-310 bacterium]